VLLFSSVMNARLVDSGVLLGLSDPRLSKAIEAMHKHPETSWSLEQLPFPASTRKTTLRFLFAL
jgi:transcriptional regulator GlxA family with amidase domain